MELKQQQLLLVVVVIAMLAAVVWVMKDVGLDDYIAASQLPRKHPELNKRHRVDAEEANLIAARQAKMQSAQSVKTPPKGNLKK